MKTHSCSDANFVITGSSGNHHNENPRCRQWQHKVDIMITLGFQLNHWPLGESECNFVNAILSLCLLIGILRSFQDNVLRWMPWDLSDDKSALAQVMAWCHHKTAMTSANDSVLCCHIVSRVHNELRTKRQKLLWNCNIWFNDSISIRFNY